MTNAAAVIGLTYDGTDLQRPDFSLFLEIIRGLNEVPEVRGTDTLVPGLAGRIARNRIADQRGIELKGYVSGTGNDIQTVTLTGSPAGGTFTLTFQGQTTAGIAWNASAAALVTALEALSNIAPGDVSARGGPFPTASVTVTFMGQYGGVNVTQMTGSSIGLTGGTPVLTIATVSQGGATEAAQRSHFRALVKLVADVFDPTRAPASLVATLEDGTTATISARTLPTLLWDQVVPSMARLSVELESVDPAWVIS